MQENNFIDRIKLGAISGALLFIAVSIVLFTVCTVITIVRSIAMRQMGEMQMPGSWSMSMTWMAVSGQNWFSAVCSFLNSWIIMMVPMMMPIWLIMLLQYDQKAGRAAAKFTRSAAMAGLGYLLIWILIGIVVFYLGVLLTTLAMKSRAFSLFVPFMTAGIIVTAGAYQFTAWKSRQLCCCNLKVKQLGGIQNNPLQAFKTGLALGVCCSSCCINLMVILLVTGMMDLTAMGLITVAMITERLYTNNRKVVHGIGVAVLIVGLTLLIRDLY